MGRKCTVGIALAVYVGIWQWLSCNELSISYAKTYAHGWSKGGKKHNDACFWWEEYILAEELGNILSDFVMYLAMTIADQKTKQLRSKIPSQIGTYFTWAVGVTQSSWETTNQQKNHNKCANGSNKGYTATAQRDMLLVSC